MTKTVWTPTEKESLKEKYGCEILVERAKKDQLSSTQFPTDAYIVEYTIDDEIMYYTAISDTAVSSLVRAQNSTTASSHSAGATVEFYQLHKVPLTEVNATHTTLGNLDID